MSIFGVMKEYEEKAIPELIKPVKQYITVWAEEAKKLHSGAYEWGFGDGTTGYKNSGYTMLAKGRIVRMGLASENTDKKNNSNVTVQIVKNGVGLTDYAVYKPPGQFSSYKIFNEPLLMEAGSVLNFRTIEGAVSRGEIPTSHPDDKGVKLGATVVSVLIELIDF